MLLWKNDCMDPYRNMAAEEYLLMTAEEPCVMLWRNTPAVVIGKNQDARTEVDFAFAERHGIRVVRRLSGGGAVFHDEGNVNYTFIVPDGTALRFSAFAQPIIKALAGLGVPVECSGRNDLVAIPDRGKCSGTAECIYNRKSPDGSVQRMLLHHGTLLFAADISAMSGVLTPDAEKLSAKGIRSVKSRVVNLKSLLAAKYAGMTAEAFKAYLEEFFQREGAVPRSFSPADLEAIESLAKSKYRSETWLIGTFEHGEKRSSRRFDFGLVAVCLCSKGRQIEALSFSGDFFGTADIEQLEKKLAGTELDAGPLEAALRRAELSRYIAGASASEIAGLILEAAHT